MVTSCSIKKHLNQNIKEDSTTHVKTVYITDSAVYHENKTLTQKIIKLEQRVSELESNITFGDGGGTFNLNTGEATNVKSVNTKSSIRENFLEAQNIRLQDSISKVNALNISLQDSLAASKKEIKTEIKTVVKTKFPWWLIPLTIFGTIVCIYILRRIPQIRALWHCLNFKEIL